MLIVGDVDMHAVWGSSWESINIGANTAKADLAAKKKKNSLPIAH